jgi:hypothetical protein
LESDTIDADMQDLRGKLRPIITDRLHARAAVLLHARSAAIAMPGGGLHRGARRTGVARAASLPALPSAHRPRRHHA